MHSLLVGRDASSTPLSACDATGIGFHVIGAGAPIAAIPGPEVVTTSFKGSALSATRGSAKSFPSATRHSQASPVGNAGLRS